ncbi:MAG: DUF4234 domain-containing protein [Candidatus Dormibacteria bacterium]
MTEPETTAGIAVAERPVDESDAAGFADVEIAGRHETPPAAHGGWDAPPVAPPPPWTFPSGAIAGRDTAKNAPLEAPLVPSLGPEGKRRKPAAVIVLSILTLGLYSLVWHSRINTELRDFDTRMHVHAGRSTFAVTIAWLIGLLVSLGGAILIVSARMQVALPYTPPLNDVQQYLLLGGLLLVPYLVLVIPFSIVGTVMTIERVRIAEDRVGRTTDVQLRPPRDVCWLVVPVIGGLVLLGIMQRRLNQVWELSAPAPAARISSF